MEQEKAASDAFLDALDRLAEEWDVTDLGVLDCISDLRHMVAIQRAKQAEASS